MVENQVIIARLFSHYTGPSNYYLYDRMRMLPAERYKTICIYLERTSDEPNNQEKDFKCFYLDGSKASPFKWKKLAAILKEENVDIVHANRHSATVQGAMGALLAGTPVVISHVHGMNRCRNTKRRLLYKLLSAKITRMIGCSQGVKDDIIKNYPGMSTKAVALPNSINYTKYHDAVSDRAALRQEFGIPEDAFVFTLVGRLVPTKGHDLLIDALSKLEAPNAYILLVGDGVLEDDIRAQADELGVLDRVIFAGFRRDVPAILKACDAFALSSIREGMPLCVFEAMAAGLPVVGTGAGGTCELMENGNLGIYISDRTADAFAEGMRKVLNFSAEERAAFVRKADEKVRSVYNHDHAVSCLQEIYESALKEKKVE